MSPAGMSLVLVALSVQVPASGVHQISGSGSEAAAVAPGRIKGVVSYYFNDNFGFKGDVGSEVLLAFGNVELPPKDTEVRFQKGLVSVTFPLSRQQQKENKDAAKRGALFPNPAKVLAVAVVDQTSVDANGSFQLDDVPPGVYTVIIRSSHTRDASFVSNRDREGRLAFIGTTVKPGRTVDASYKFPATGVLGSPPAAPAPRP